MRTNEQVCFRVSALLMYGSTLFLISLNIIPISAFKEPVGSVLHGTDISVLNFEHRVGCPNNRGRPVWVLGSIIHYFQIGTLMGSVLIYVICFWIIFSKKRQGGTKVMSSNEWRLLLLTVIPCVIKTSSQIFFYYVCASTEIGQLFQLWFLVFEQGYHPFLYITVNKKIRFHMFKLYCCGKIPQFKLVTVQTNAVMTIANPTSMWTKSSQSPASRN
uniref:Uncharacterized protein n=1 Tax=Acrobeloides nanus TaxID=290746 RepID=A0A914D9A3_9BILA